MVESSKALAPWRQDVKFAALAALEDHPLWPRELAALSMHVTFSMPRPRAHYRTGKFAHLLRDGAPTHHGTKPDLDKLLRAVGDALTAAGVYADDSRVSHVFATKTYVSALTVPPGVMATPGARIVLAPMGVPIGARS